MTATPSSPTVFPVILSGGSGMRLWPMSRALYPKQLLPLHSDRGMLQDTAVRTHGDGFGDPLIICNEEHRFIVAEQLREVGISPSAILLEPVGRNTAPAVAVAALFLAENDPDALMLVLPSDHVIDKLAAFHDAITTAAGAAAGGALVTFGIRPEKPETGYGYIRRGQPLKDLAGCFEVERFVEKPDLPTAAGYLADGNYDWNSGMFLFKASSYLAELGRLHPEMVEACKQALAEGARDLDFYRLAAEPFGQCPSRSIDYAVMEHTTHAAVVPADIGWSDVGSWGALWEIADKDASGNVLTGDVMTHDVKDSFIRSEDGLLVAAVGIENVVVVVTDDAVLVADKAHSQNVKAITEGLKAQSRIEHHSHSTVYRPWGHYRTLNLGDHYQVKQITVKPGSKLSLQKHHHRAEHWIVVEGTALVTKDDETFLVTENQSTYIPIGTRHRLENPGKVPLHLIEVQSGRYLGEDDIVRFEDDYGRG